MKRSALALGILITLFGLVSACSSEETTPAACVPAPDNVVAAVLEAMPSPVLVSRALWIETSDQPTDFFDRFPKHVLGIRFRQSGRDADDVGVWWVAGEVEVHTIVSANSVAWRLTQWGVDLPFASEIRHTSEALRVANCVED